MSRSRVTLAVAGGVLIAWLWSASWLPAQTREGRASRAAPSKAKAPDSAGGRSSALPAPSFRRAERESGDPFASAAQCATLLTAASRLPRAPRTARFASWNLRWFPDGVPGNAEPGTDVRWLACVLAWLDADVIAVQEVKQTPKAERALATLLSELNRWTGGRFVARLDDCGRRVPQHVGLLWNEARVRASALETIAALNPSGAPCERQWRPGFSGRFAFPGGLDLTVVSAHFKSHADPRSIELREASFGAIPGVFRAAERATRDADWLLLGDLNTMGCESCEPKVSAAEELSAASAQLSRAGLRVVAADARGTELYRGRYTLLDHALGSSAMRELDEKRLTHVAGPCRGGARGSARKPRKPPLSDHCPLVLDLHDRDWD